MDDAALLRGYADAGSEGAFAEFVRRYLPLVYGSAVRRVGGDMHAAEDVTQLVFAAVARDAARLAAHPNVAGWLFTTTRFLATKVVRTEQRRRHRERLAVMVQAADARPAEPGPATANADVQRMLDEALMELRDLDRQMLLMRFYRGLRLAEIARQVNSSENAVQKRVDRALDRLNVLLSRRGITSTATALAIAVEHHAAVTVPAGLAGSATAAGLASGAGALASVPIPAMVIGTKLKIAAAAVVIGAVATTVAWFQRESARLQSDLPSAVALAEATPRSSPPAAAVPSATQAATPAAAASRAVPPPVTMPRPTAPALPVPEPDAIAPPNPAAGQMVPLQVEYPRPLFAGTPRPIQVANLEPAVIGKRPPFLVPAGATLLSKGKPVASSDSLPVIGELAYLTDGGKSGTDGTYVELGPGSQWVQIDLGAGAWIDATVVWHFHSQSRVYHDVIVQISNDREFRTGVTTVFNNDHDNSSRLGLGRDWAYVETNEGRIISGRGARGRYVRLYSNGNTADELNHYVEVEVYGRR